MLSQKDFGDLQAILIQNERRGASSTQKVDSPMIRLLRVSRMPRPFSTAPATSGRSRFQVESFESNIAASLSLAQPSVRWGQGAPGDCRGFGGIKGECLARFAGEAALLAAAWAAAIACFASVSLKDDVLLQGEPE